MLPLVFGISFQLPVLMVFFTRIGLTTARGYLTYWKQAAFGMGLFAAVITPTSDVITWAYLFVPMFSLYVLGAAVCSVVEPGPAPPVSSVSVMANSNPANPRGLPRWCRPRQPRIAHCPRAEVLGRADLRPLRPTRSATATRLGTADGRANLRADLPGQHPDKYPHIHKN